MTGTAGPGAQISRALAEREQPDDPVDEGPVEPDTPPDRSRRFRGANLSRMRLEPPDPGDRLAMQRIAVASDMALKERFKTAFDVLEDLWMSVREPEVDADGVVARDPSGAPKWRLDERGNPVEDYENLSSRARELLLWKITTHLTEWELAAAGLWEQAMYAKASWERAFASGYIKLPGAAISGKPTIEDRTQTATAYSMEERYDGVFLAALSRKAEALVRSLIRIQRLLSDAEFRA